MMSSCATTPTRRPRRSTTGAPLMFFSWNRSQRSAIDISSETVIGSRVIRSAARRTRFFDCLAATRAPAARGARLEEAGGRGRRVRADVDARGVDQRLGVEDLLLADRLEAAAGGAHHLHRPVVRDRIADADGGRHRLPRLHPDPLAVPFAE